MSCMTATGCKRVATPRPGRPAWTFPPMETRRPWTPTCGNRRPDGASWHGAIRWHAARWVAALG
jgi:hypothetical protein